jgi:hypothetical protein
MPRWPEKPKPVEPLTDQEKLAKINRIISDPDSRRVRYRREMLERIRRVLSDEPEPSISVGPEPVEPEAEPESKTQGSWLPGGPIAPLGSQPAPVTKTAEPEAAEPVDRPKAGTASRNW